MSRELKVLAGLLVVTVAAWVWADTTSPYASVTPAASASAQAPVPAAPLPAGTPGEADGAQDEAAEDGADTENGNETGAETGPGPLPAGPTPASADSPPAGARELRIATLPFLVTEEPVFEDLETAEEEPLVRPQGARATVNPFAPIVVRTPPGVVPPAPEAAVPVAPPADVPIRLPDGVIQAPPAAPAVAPTISEPPLPPSAPAPSAVAPSARAASSSRLPQALPGGTLPVTPALLDRQRGELAAAPPPPQPDLSSRVAVSVPRPAPPSAPHTVAPAERLPDTETAMTARLAEPAPLQQLRSGGAAVSAPPTSLRSFLQEHEVSFTGAVLGPVGVGIFKTRAGTVVVPLGQTLPQSDIVLTDLNGQWAELALDGTKETLPIDPRR